MDLNVAGIALWKDVAVCVLVASATFRVMLAKSDLNDDEVQLTLRYGIWNQLTFSPELRHFVSTSEVRVELEGQRAPPDNKEDYMLFSDAGSLELLYGCDFFGEAMDAGTDSVTYNVTFNVPKVEYKSTVYVWNSSRDDFDVTDQTTVFEGVQIKLWNTVMRGLDGTGTLWDVYVNSARFHRSKVSDSRLARGVLFEGSRFYGEAMKKVAEDHIMVSPFLRDVFKSILDDVHYNI